MSRSLPSAEANRATAIANGRAKIAPVICSAVVKTPLLWADTPISTSSGSSCSGAWSVVLREWWERACPPRPRSTERSTSLPLSASARPPRVRQATHGRVTRVPIVQARKMAMPPS